MKCPRCSTTITVKPDAAGFLTCPGCGVKLRSRPVNTPLPGPAPAPAAPARPADRDQAAARAEGRRGLDGLSADATMPATAAPKIPRPAPVAAPAAPAPAPAPPPPAAPSGPATLEGILAEVRALRRQQDEILALLRGRPGAAPARPAPASPGGREEVVLGDDDTDIGGHSSAPVRSRQRKAVLLIDDDPATRNAAVSAFQRADIAVRPVADGNAGLGAIAQERPDVIVLELDLAGAMAGKDVVNLIKATMEWVDIPIVLYTRAAIESQKEARTVHGADDFVLKDHGPDPLVAKVIAFFRKG